MPDDEHTFSKFLSDMGLLVFIGIICLISYVLPKKWNKSIGKIANERNPLK